MKFLYSFLCDSADVREDGRLDVLGVFHQLYAPGFPAQQERMVLVLALEWQAGEEGRNAFRIDLLDPAASPVVTVSGHTDVAPAPEGEAPPLTRLVLPMEGIVFPAAGTYEFELTAGGQTRRIAPIHLIEDRDVG